MYIVLTVDASGPQVIPITHFLSTRINWNGFFVLLVYGYERFSFRVLYLVGIGLVGIL